MKESILGRFDFSSKVRMVVMTGLFMLLGISATFSQNYMTNADAASALRTELTNIENSIVVSPFVAKVPAMLAQTAPQTYAYWYMVDAIYEYLSEAGPTADVRTAIDYARDRGAGSGLVLSIYFNNAHHDVTDLLTY